MSQLRSNGSESLKRQADLEDLDRIEGELGFKAAPDGGALAKAVLLAREQEIADCVALAPKRVDHGLGLVRRHNCVFIALKENHRLRESVDVAKRRALAIALLFLRKGTDQPVQISRLEFVRVACERRGGAHAIV